ncbi:MAG TPA: POTRA domain-containing protein [Cyclobacteriaceae bacterium]|nr:POTRA domain-containing protein [Cyclobacteriaceae bacterium]
MHARLVTIALGILILTGAGAQAQNGGSSNKRSRDDASSTDTTTFELLTLNKVIIAGNKTTRDRIILRELSLSPGDTVSNVLLPDILQKDKNKIYNLRLFNTVELRPITVSSGRFDLLVEVTERWYTFPVPIFEISDRNFNEWWQTYDHDLSRVNYGLRLYQYNFRGRNETLRLTAQFGFSRRYDLAYQIPNLDKNQKQGLSFLFSFAEPKNLSYFTEDHKLLFLKSQEVLRTSTLFAVNYSYRKSFYETHNLGLEYRTSAIADTIALLNPNYYVNGEKKQRFEAITYSFTSDHRDVFAYPLNGHHSNIYLKKIGLGLSSGVDQFEVNLTHAQYIDLKNGYYFSNFSSLYLSTPQSQPYSLYNAIGYRKQFLRGYEIYVIEGSRFFLNKATLKKRIFTRGWHLANMPHEQFSYFPLSIYLKGYVDMGYVENFSRYQELAINNTLSNRFLIGAGGGLDIVTVYDAVLRFEYSFTREGTHGFFFNVKKEF